MFTYIRLKNKKRFAKFQYSVEDIGYLTNYRTSPESYCYSKLEVCIRLSGNDAYALDTIEGQTFQTPYPHLLLKKPGICHSFHACDDREALFFIYSKKICHRLTDTGFLPDSCIQPLTMTGELNSLIRRMKCLMAASEENSSADKIDLTCFAILEELLYQRTIQYDAAKGKIQQIASFLQANVESDPDFKKIAADYGLSERSFYRYWKKSFELTPAQYVLELKMKHAAWLLTHTSIPVREIAHILHFCDDNCFSTRFRLFYGVSPRKYKENTDE